MANKIQVRRGLEEDLPVLSAGEFGLCTDTGNVYIGTGDGNVLVTIDGDALQANIDALEESGVKNPNALTLTLNGSGTDYDGSEAASKTWYAPTSVAGGAGYELVAGGTATTSVPVWKAPSYGVCSTAAATAAKTVSCTNFKLVTGVHMTVKFTYSHTSSTAATLNVGGTGAKTIYNGMTGNTVTSSYGVWSAGEIVEFVYDGTYWRAVSSSMEWLHADCGPYIPLDDTRYISASEIGDAIDSKLDIDFSSNGFVGIDEVTEAIDEVAPLAVYSETATQIGTWTDGRAVYRKCGTYTRSTGATLANIPNATGISYLNTGFVIRENYAVGKSDDECDGCYASQSEALAAMNSNTSEKNVMRYVVEYVALE